MPELPEVESTVRFLRERIIGERVSLLEVLWGRSIAAASEPRYAELIANQTVSAIERRGKYIVIKLASTPPALEGGCYLLCHLRMSGSLDVVPKGVPVHGHDRVLVHFHGGRELRFNDSRKFGRMYVVRDPLTILGSLGVEPLSDEFTREVLQHILGERKGAIKPLLLDQTLVVGIGNIYADEVLWRAGINPLLPPVRVSDEQWTLLFQAIGEVLSEAIALQGTDFGDGVVEMGNFAPSVYGRDGSPCLRCGSLILRMVVAQRGTHFCPSCQGGKPRTTRAVPRRGKEKRMRTKRSGSEKKPGPKQVSGHSRRKVRR